MNATDTNLQAETAQIPEDTLASWFAPIDGDSLVMREQALQQRMDEIQAYMLTLPQTEIPVTNIYAGGVYAREIFIPKGTVAMGRLQLTEHLNVFLQGDMTFVTTDGPKRIQAPLMFAAPPGTKKLAYAHEDSRWVTVHPDLGLEPEQMVEALSVSTFSEYRQLLDDFASQQLTNEQPDQTSDPLQGDNQ